MGSLSEDLAQLSTRDATGVLLQDDSASVSLDTDQFGQFTLEKQSGSTVTVNAAVGVPVYHRLVVHVWNNGTGGNVTVTWGTNFNTNSTTVVPDNTVETVLFFSRFDASGTDSEWYAVGTSLDVPE